MTPSTAEVVLLGDLNVDLHLDIPVYPAPGGDGVATRQRMGFGGSAANTAVMLSRLGVRASMIACIGDDEWGEQAFAGLAEQGVDTSLVMRSAVEGTSLNVITVTPDGERTMFAYRGASAHLREEGLPPSFPGASILHVSGYALLAEPQRSAAVAAVASAHRSGLTVSLDVPVDPVAAVPEVLLAFLASVDAVVIGAAEARRLTGANDDEDAARRLAAHGPTVVALTGGAAGSLVRIGAATVRAPVPTIQVVDTTGAGDSFCAGLIFGLLRGIAEPELVASLANACGAAAVAVAGAGAQLPSPDGIASAVRALPPSIAERLLGIVERSRGVPR